MEQNVIHLKYKKSLDNHRVDIDWKVKNFEKVGVGQLLANVIHDSSYFMNPIPIYSKSSGYCKIVQNGTIDELWDALGYILEKEKGAFPNIPMDTVDEFSGTHTILWEKIGGYKAIGIPLQRKSRDYLYLSSIYKDGKISLVIYFVSKVYNLKKGDTISFKFSSGKVLDFSISARPAKVQLPISLPEDDEENRDYFNASFDGYVYPGRQREYIKKVCFFLSSVDLLTFIKDPIVSYRLTYNSEGGASVDGIPHNFEMAPPVCQEVIKDMFQVLAEMVSKYDSSYDLDNLNVILDKDSGVVQFEYCYVYLMHDTNTGYYKIGMSNNPAYREGTLQSEKPTIELLACHKYPSRKFAAAIESALHNVYKDFHVRGGMV